jgi:hypothetical protein
MIFCRIDSEIFPKDFRYDFSLSIKPLGYNDYTHVHHPSWTRSASASSPALTQSVTGKNVHRLVFPRMTCTNGRIGLAPLDTALPVLGKGGCSVPLNLNTPTSAKAIVRTASQTKHSDRLVPST